MSSLENSSDIMIESQNGVSLMSDIIIQPITPGDSHDPSSPNSYADYGGYNLTAYGFNNNYVLEVPQNHSEEIVRQDNSPQIDNGIYVPPNQNVNIHFDNRLNEIQYVQNENHNLPPSPESPAQIPKQVVPKRARTQYSSMQLVELEKEFQISRYLCRPKRINLAHTLCLSEKQIKVWFQNRRMKHKKEKGKGKTHSNSNQDRYSSPDDTRSEDSSPKILNNSERPSIVNRLLTHSVLGQNHQYNSFASPSAFQAPTTQWGNGFYPSHHQNYPAPTYSLPSDSLELGAHYNASSAYGRFAYPDGASSVQPGVQNLEDYYYLQESRRTSPPQYPLGLQDSPVINPVWTEDQYVKDEMPTNNVGLTTL